MNMVIARRRSRRSNPTRFCNRLDCFATLAMTILCAFLLVSACKKPDQSHPHTQSLIPFEKPVIYARYEALPALLRTNPGPCKNAFAFRAPDQYRLRKFMDLCGPIGQKDPWLVPAGFQSFQWEQDLKEGEKVQLELIGSDGVPLPSTARVSKTGSRVFVQLKSTENMRNNSVLLITATLLDTTGKKLTSWSIPFKITGS